MAYAISKTFSSTALLESSTVYTQMTTTKSTEPLKVSACKASYTKEEL